MNANANPERRDLKIRSPIPLIDRQTSTYQRPSYPPTYMVFIT